MVIKNAWVTKRSKVWDIKAELGFKKVDLTLWIKVKIREVESLKFKKKYKRIVILIIWNKE